MQNKIRAKDKFMNFVLDAAKVLCFTPLFLLLRTKLYYPFGKPSKKGAILVVANHRNPTDPLLLHLALPFRSVNFIATKELYTSKLKSMFLKSVRCVCVDKENFSLSAFHKVIDLLEKGQIMAIFPEGKLNRASKENMLAFKSGVMLMAHKSGAPILPLYILRRKKWFHRQRIVIGMPIDTKDLLGKIPSVAQISQASDVLREKELELREYLKTVPNYHKFMEVEND